MNSVKENIKVTLLIFVKVTRYYFENSNGGRRTKSIEEFNKVIEHFVVSSGNFT